MTDRVMTRNMKAQASGGDDEQRSETSLIDLMKNSYESRAQENEQNAENSTQPKTKSPRHQEPVNTRKSFSEDFVRERQHLGFRGSDRSQNYGFEPSEYPSFHGS